MAVETVSRQIITKRGQMLGSVEDPMGNLPRQVNDSAIDIKEEQLTPSRRLIKRTKDRKELLFTVRRNSVGSQKHKVRRLGGNCRDLTTDNSSANIQNTRRRCRTTRQTPSTEQRNIKGWQIDIKNRRISKRLDRREPQAEVKPINQKRDP